MTMFIDLTDQEVPEPKPDNTCECEKPDPHKWECGYGMAGGGMGIYTYCPICGCIVDKIQDKDIS